MQSNLGYCYENGIVVAKNDQEAFVWYEKAAQQGDNFGQANLGYCYETGIGTTKNIQQAIVWYQKAAQQGNHFAGKRLENLLTK